MSALSGLTYSWHEGRVPLRVSVKQVYGWVFDTEGRVLLQETRGGWNLPGGSPERFDVDVAATLRREAMEESQVELEAVAFLGYEAAAGEGEGDQYALVRMAALVSRAHPRSADPDGGQLYGRWLVDVTSATDLLDWGESGVQQAAAAATLARREWGLPVDRQGRAIDHLD